MHLGFVDGKGRTYDLSFRTTKRRLWDADGDWVLEPGEKLSAPHPLEASVVLEGNPPRLLMRPTTGTARSSERRLVFLAGDDVERSPEDPTTFQVAIHVPPTAVDHLLREAGGREVLEVRREDIRALQTARGEVLLRADDRSLDPKAVTSLQFALRPADAARAVLAPLRL